jgi:hypothetical protein
VTRRLTTQRTNITPYRSRWQNMEQICDFPSHLCPKRFSTKSNNISLGILIILFFVFRMLVYKHSAPPLTSSRRGAHYPTDEHQTQVFSNEVPSTLFALSQLTYQSVHYIDYLFCITINFHQIHDQEQGLCQL